MNEDFNDQSTNGTRDLVIKVLTHLRFVDKDLMSLKEDIKHKASKEKLDKLIEESNAFRDMVKHFMDEQATTIKVKSEIQVIEKGKKEDEKERWSMKLSKFEIIAVILTIIISLGWVWEKIIFPLLKFIYPPIV